MSSSRRPAPIVLVALLALGTFSFAAASELATVTRVVDGDTIVVEIQVEFSDCEVNRAPFLRSGPPPRRETTQPWVPECNHRKSDQH